MLDHCFSLDEVNPPNMNITRPNGACIRRWNPNMCVIEHEILLSFWCHGFQIKHYRKAKISLKIVEIIGDVTEWFSGKMTAMTGLALPDARVHASNLLSLKPEFLEVVQCSANTARSYW